MSTATEQKPEGDAKAPILLYSYRTPNGQKAAICLEELKAAYPGAVEYDVRKMDMQTGEHMADWYIKVCILALSIRMYHSLCMC